MPRCEVCGEEHGEMVIHSRCHPQSPTWVWLSEDGLTASIRCAACDALVGDLHLVHSPV